MKRVRVRIVLRAAVVAAVMAAAVAAATAAAAAAGLVAAVAGLVAAVVVPVAVVVAVGNAAVATKGQTPQRRILSAARSHFRAAFFVRRRYSSLSVLRKETSAA